VISSEIIYYAGYLPGRGKPTTVYRFYKDENKLPERYTLSDGWVEDRDIWLMKMKGDITEAAKIDADKAEEIIKELKGE
jgi:hypothetical protein